MLSGLCSYAHPKITNSNIFSSWRIPSMDHRFCLGNVSSLLSTWSLFEGNIFGEREGRPNQSYFVCSHGKWICHHRMEATSGQKSTSTQRLTVNHSNWAGRRGQLLWFIFCSIESHWTMCDVNTRNIMNPYHFKMILHSYYICRNGWAVLNEHMMCGHSNCL